MNKNERVNHPTYYSHPSGYECIDLIRDYVCNIAMALKCLWRAGLKTEEGISNKEKEIEDLEKALWYIKDYEQNMTEESPRFTYHFRQPYNCNITKIVEAYTNEIADAIQYLTNVGCIVNGELVRTPLDRKKLQTAALCIKRRIRLLNNNNNKKGNDLLWKKYITENHIMADNK